MREIDGKPVYKITIDPKYSENGEDLGVDMIAFTNNPAIQVKGMAFSNQVKKQFFKDEVKMRIAAPSMIPMDIYRKDEDGTEYYVEFTAEVIEQIHSKMMANLKTKDLFNLEHEAEKKVPAYVHEILLVDSKAKQKYIKDEYDIDTELGSQFVVSQITDKDYYNSLVENEQFAYSIEGFLGLKLNKHDKMEYPRFELDGKFYDLIDGKPVEVALETTEEVSEEVEEVTEVAEESAEVALEETTEEVVLEDDKEEEKEEMAEEEVEEKEEELAVDPELDAEAVLNIVAPQLEELKKELLQVIGEAMNETEEEEEEVEMTEAKLSLTQKFAKVGEMFRNVNY